MKYLQSPLSALRAARLDVPGSFEAAQRERFLFANVLALGLTLTLIALHQFVPEREATGYSVHVNILFAVFWLGFVRAIFTWKKVHELCRVWLVLVAISLWWDGIVSGGVTGHAAPFLVLPAVGAGLILRAKDIVITGIASVLAIVIIGVYEINATPMSDNPMIVTDMVLLIVATIGVTVTVLTLVTHHHQMDEKRRKLLNTQAHMARHDSLTGLINRAHVSGFINALGPESVCHNLFLIDLDGFKEINDLYGHDIGDKLLILAAARLNAAAPRGARVARLGGDEFLMLTQADGKGRTRNWPEGECPGQALVEVLHAPFLIDGQELRMTTSVGVAHFPGDAGDGEALFKRADLALYAAKGAGRNQCCAFTPDLQIAQNERLSLQTRLRAAVKSGEVFLHYQPQFRLTDGALTGFEALARWHDDVHGVVAPEKFITIAEECGLIVELGEQILRRACREAMEWPAIGHGGTPLQLSVNVSVLQLNGPDISARVRAILEETGFPPDHLELEITESVLATHSEQTRATLSELAAMGISLAMDDFGKGYSSLSYLQSFALTRLKIDRSFINRLHRPNGTPIVRAIISLAKAMNLSVVAEGVETVAQREILCELGCDYAQGFLYARGLDRSGVMNVIIRHAIRHVSEGFSDLPELVEKEPRDTG